jgi:hypothetical protein
MISLEDIEIYLPKYLSDDAKGSLFSELSQFPYNIDTRLYTNYLAAEPRIFQGDGIRDLLYIELPSEDIKTVNGIVLSNTCDINPENVRFIPMNVAYAPIISFDKYIQVLRDNGIEAGRIDQHCNTIKTQKITNIFYLPGGSALSESIVFLDRVNSCNIGYFRDRNIQGYRLFTLSDYGFYLFLTKLSIHFTRIRERVERRSAS